jgi:nuclear pore complex protein Nup160
MASHPQPTDIGHVWTLSRDRTLRLWTAKSGCVSAKTLPLTSLERALSLVPGTATSDSNPNVLLEAEPQRLLRVFSISLSPEKEQHFVLAFSPTPASSQSGGFFQLFSTDADYLHSIGTIQCSDASAHCHLQDFVVVNGDILYVLWDRQGQSNVEKMALSPGQMMGQSSVPSWFMASYPPEPELTPAYLDELLLSPGSMTDKFFEAVMRPGMFSSLTLRTAIDQYTSTCLSLPGPPPPRLVTTYATLGEHIAAVVGSTVSLHRDPHTGALQHANYWNALKRDWEGFIARCREVERSARWPLALGVGNMGDIIVVERERAGALVGEDFALQMHRLVSSSYPMEPQHALLSILWTLRTKIGPQSVLNLENRLIGILHQETAFPFADIILDEAQRSNFADDLDEGLEIWMNGRLQSIENLNAAIHSVLDVVGGFDQRVKIEEDDSDLPLPVSSSDWTRALTATYTASTIQARYDLCLALVTLLFLISEELVDWEPALLTEIIAVFRGIAMLRYLAQQPAGDTGAKTPADGTRMADDVTSRLRDMQVSKSQTRFRPTYSLIHCLLAESSDTHILPGATHRFLDATGLLQSTSPAHVAKAEVLFCERLRLLGYYEVTREILFWLPRTPGVSYVLALLWLNTGRADDAAYLLEKLAGSFGMASRFILLFDLHADMDCSIGINSGLSAEDNEALAAVLPGGEIFYSDYAFYLHAASLFKSGALVCHDVHFSQLALSVAHSEANTTDLWYSVVKGHIDLALYEDAYASLIACPYNKLYVLLCRSYVVTLTNSVIGNGNASASWSTACVKGMQLRN